MSSWTHVQVAIVGGGPVGMCLAAELAGYGVRTLVLESRTSVSQRPKATTLHARSVQCLVRRGHLAGLVSARGAASSPFHFAGIPGLEISAPEGEPEPVLKCAQADLERVFEARARAAGARVLRGLSVTDVVQKQDAVRVTATGPGGRWRWRAGYLVGADGARSAVRELAGIGSRTYPATVSAMMGRVRLRHVGDLQEGWHRTPRGWIVAKGSPDGAFHLRTLNCQGEHADRYRPLGLDELRREVSWIAGRDIGMSDPRWLSRFSDFSRIARAYRSGRVLLAGDAAHVHFPIGGQGLSTGLLDAVNLGWKLALTVRGGAGRGLLDTYDQERRPAAQRVVDNTRAQLALMRPGAELDPLRELFCDILAKGSEHGLAAMISSQDTVLPSRTGCSSAHEGRFLQNVPLTTAQGPTDVIGVLRQGRPVLLLLGERGSGYAEQARDWSRSLHVVHAAATPELSCEALLVRPDGYIAWASDGDALGEALTAYLGSGRHRAGTGMAPALS
ncbi:FAD-dependent monooxygenase [Streptomyces sp. NPDC019990]|uniref:FAD-dependent monooxygenase n=1 Tax=Streptomyces sp. NPDC019990 TaxID=3154693 RepID=UPI0033D20D0D